MIMHNLMCEEQHMPKEGLEHITWFITLLLRALLLDEL